MEQAERERGARERARERFRGLAEGRESAIGLAEGALWLAAEHCAGVDVARELSRVEALTERLRRQLAGVSGQRARVARLLSALTEGEGYRGAAPEAYYDPRNSFLNEVLARKRGIPITLSVLFVEVARRLGFEAEGVGFPGHFLAKVRLETGEGVQIVDVFSGQLLSEGDCAERLRGTLGAAARLEPEMLRAARPREVLARMLSNLKQIYVQRADFESALRCCDRLLMLAPDAPFELRDRGLVFQRLDCHHAAVEDFERFVELAPGHPTVPAVRQALVQSKAQAGPLH